MKFKVDENLPRQVADLLRQAGHDALTVNEQRLKGSSDDIVGEVCRAEGRCIVTLDLDFADRRQFPPQSYAGIIVLRQSQQEKPFVLTVMQNLIPHIESLNPAGMLWIVDENRIRISRGATDSAIGSL